MRELLLALLALPAWSQTPEAMLAAARAARWEQPYVARASCRQRKPVQMDIYATQQWTHHCVETRGGIVRESFYYVFGEPARTALLRVDLRPESGLTIDQVRALFTSRLGVSDHKPEMMEIGFRSLRFGQPVAGDHWKSGPIHYFLHVNQSHSAPLGVRTGVQLIVLHERLFDERARDEFILEVDGIGTAEATDEPNADPIGLLRQAARAAGGDRARLLLAANRAIHRLAGKMSEAQAPPLRRALAPYGVKLGPEGHYGGILYYSELLWRVWREFPNTEAGERAFVELQNRGWYTNPNIGCPPNPDLFHDVIGHGEAFLAARPATHLRKEVLFTVAAAYESWWSIARAPADDGIVSMMPYPRRVANARGARRARLRAIEYYREIVRIAPDAPEAAAALRRLPRLELDLDTGQRRFFCFTC
jgi:hypothetical protein